LNPAIWAKVAVAQELTKNMCKLTCRLPKSKTMKTNLSFQADLRNVLTADCTSFICGYENIALQTL
jgi:hypothetical protein